MQRGLIQHRQTRIVRGHLLEEVRRPHVRQPDAVLDHDLCYFSYSQGYCDSEGGQDVLE